MGQSAEKMAHENGITREAQDLIAFQSHQKAAAATDDGRLARELIPVLAPPRYEPAIVADNLLRRDTTHGGAGRAAAGLRPPATARSPRATPRRSPTARRRCS